MRSNALMKEDRDLMLAEAPQAAAPRIFVKEAPSPQAEPSTALDLAEFAEKYGFEVFA